MNDPQVASVPLGFWMTGMASATDTRPLMTDRNVSDQFGLPVSRASMKNGRRDFR